MARLVHHRHRASIRTERWRSSTDPHDPLLRRCVIWLYKDTHLFVRNLRDLHYFTEQLTKPHVFPAITPMLHVIYDDQAWTYYQRVKHNRYRTLYARVFIDFTLTRRRTEPIPTFKHRRSITLMTITSNNLKTIFNSWRCYKSRCKYITHL